MVFVNHLNGYKIKFSTKADKDLEKIDPIDIKKITQKLKLLVQGAQNLDVKKLENKKEPTYRLRCGNYRIIYVVEEIYITVVVIEIGHRREIYR